MGISDLWGRAETSQAEHSPGAKCFACFLSLAPPNTFWSVFVLPILRVRKLEFRALPVRTARAGIQAQVRLSSRNSFWGPCLLLEDWTSSLAEAVSTVRVGTSKGRERVSTVRLGGNSQRAGAVLPGSKPVPGQQLGRFHRIMHFPVWKLCLPHRMESLPGQDADRGVC